MDSQKTGNTKTWRKLLGKIVHVRWLDILSDPAWHSDKADLPKPAPCETAGFLVKVTSSYIVVAATRGNENEQGDRDHGDSIAIPVGTIQNVAELAPKDP